MKLLAWHFLMKSAWDLALFRFAIVLLRFFLRSCREQVSMIGNAGGCASVIIGEGGKGGLVGEDVAQGLGVGGLLWEPG